MHRDRRYDCVAPDSTSSVSSLRQDDIFDILLCFSIMSILYATQIRALIWTSGNVPMVTIIIAAIHHHHLYKSQWTETQTKYSANKNSPEKYTKTEKKE